MQVAVIGGTNGLGLGLALRLAGAGHQVIIGSRSAAKAEEAARQAAARLDNDLIRGEDNAAAAAAGALVFVAVPYAAQAATLMAIRPHVAGKIVVDVTVPLVAGKPTQLETVPAGSAAEQAQALLGPEVRVCSAFHHVAAAALADLDHPVATDILVAGADPASRAEVIELIRSAGMQAFDVGPLRMARYLQGLTPLMIALNIRLKKQHIGIKLTGL